MTNEQNDKVGNIKAGGWETLSENTVYENAWIKVSHHDVKRPNKTEGIYGVVHFKNKAVGVVPLDDDGYTWIVKQSRYTLDCYTWEIPEGGSPNGEEPLETAKRELKEEAGITAKHWEPLLTMHTSNSVSDEVAYLFLARELSFGEQELDDTEDIEVKKIHFDEVLEMAMNNDITDAMSQAAIFKIALLRAAGKFLF